MFPAKPPLPPLDFSSTQRLVLLIDLYPLLTSLNPTTYRSAITSAASRLLSFPQLSTSLFSYKFFFSSLSPERSATVLPRQLSTNSLSFNLPLETLDSLSTALNSFSIDADSIYSSSPPTPLCVIHSLIQLIHDYAWETENENSYGKDDLIDGDFAKKFCRNLVILFSPIVSYIECSNGTQFDALFWPVREKFRSRDIHLCWIDVVESDYEMKVEGVEEMKSDSGLKLALLKDAIKKMGWSFCSSNLIILGSALLPLGLIYPKITNPFDLVDLHGSDKKNCYGALSLEILDVKSKPLECRCCDLEFVSLMSSPSCIKSDGTSNRLEIGDAESQKCGQDTFLGRFGNESIKLHVTKVHRYDACVNNRGASEIVLVHERFQGSGKDTRKTGGDFFASRVLEMLHEEMGGASNTSQLPIWQIFLSFLYMKGYWALVSISSSNGSTFEGNLKPFTSHWAVLSVFDDDHISVKAQSGSELPKLDIHSHYAYAEDMNNSNSCHGSQIETSKSNICAPNRDGKKKKSQRYPYQDMTWRSFCKASFEGSNFDLFEVYGSRQFEKSKKLKFLKCWIKQIVKVDPYQLTTLQQPKSLEELATCKGLLPVPSHEHVSTMPVSNAETLESFSDILSKTIQHGLESGMDLQNLAERVVKSSFQWLNQKCETGNSSEGQQPRRDLNDSCSGAVELIKLLLKKPKEMKKICQDDTPFPKSSDYSSSDNIVREYEMQIFLRMEILLSDFSAMIEESRKQKLVKQICSMLELMQYLVAGGLHGHISLYDYVEQIIKARYADRIGDVVENIYSELEMDLLVFGEEDETPNLLFNSEDSNQSWRDNNRHEQSKIAETNNINRSLSTEGDSSQPPPAHADKSPQKHVRILSEAKERRERNRRFVSFTSRAPDLQRVWAPKQSKPMKGKFDSLPKRSKKKDRKGSDCSVVSETPMTGNKRSRSRENREGDKEGHDPGKSSYSVSKALFQDSNNLDCSLT